MLNMLARHLRLHKSLRLLHRIMRLMAQVNKIIKLYSNYCNRLCMVQIHTNWIKRPCKKLNKMSFGRNSSRIRLHGQTISNSTTLKKGTDKDKIRYKLNKVILTISLLRSKFSHNLEKIHLPNRRTHYRSRLLCQKIK